MTSKQLLPNLKQWFSIFHSLPNILKFKGNAMPSVLTLLISIRVKLINRLKFHFNILNIADRELAYNSRQPCDHVFRLLVANSVRQ